MGLVRTLLFALFFYAGTAVVVVLALPAAAIGKGVLQPLIHGWARWHRWCARFLLGVRTRIEGEPRQGATIVVAKHQSMFEAIDMLVLLDTPAVVMKKQLTDIPGWGQAAKLYGVISIDRDGGAKALREMLTRARAAIADGRPIMIFPEGTRVLPGETPPLQPGFVGLYKALGVPIVPIAIDSGRIWPRRGFVKRPGTVTMRVGEAIPPGLSRAEVETRVHAAINALEISPAAAPRP